MTYLAFDPGRATGWARFSDDGDSVSARFGTLTLEELMDFCEKEEPAPSVVIIETFVLFKHRALQQSGSSMEAPQAIGIIKAAARKWGATVVEQRPDIKKIAEKWSGVSPIGAHKNSHWVDAYNHGVYYLTKIGKWKSPLQQSGGQVS